ncbi:hypothetical protein KSP39_PZI015943 [Platanthera zijinensis]|uniref:Uncharacterized protein n=1 Tax=Platanthera zijinensis TaxID=2320716 RepID=A0AAP0G1S3_9ASPA
MPSLVAPARNRRRHLEQLLARSITSVRLSVSAPFGGRFSSSRLRAMFSQLIGGLESIHQFVSSQPLMKAHDCHVFMLDQLAPAFRGIARKEWSKRRQNNVARVDVQLPAELQRLVRYRAQELITKSGRYVRHHAPLNIEKWSLIPTNITDKIINIIYVRVEIWSNDLFLFILVLRISKIDFVANDRSIDLSYGPCELSYELSEKVRIKRLYRAYYYVVALLLSPTQTHGITLHAGVQLP